MQDVDKFIDDLIREKGTASADQEVMAEVKSEMKEILAEQTEKEAIMRLGEEKINELAELMDSPSFSEDDLKNFLQRSGVSLDEAAEATRQRFREYYLNANATEEQ